MCLASDVRPLDLGQALGQAPMYKQLAAASALCTVLRVWLTADLISHAQRCRLESDRYVQVCPSRHSSRYQPLGSDTLHPRQHYLAFCLRHAPVPNLSSTLYKLFINISLSLSRSLSRSLSLSLARYISLSLDLSLPISPQYINVLSLQII